MEKNQVGTDVILRLIQVNGLTRLVNCLDYQKSQVLRKLALIVMVKLLFNNFRNQQRFCQQLNIHYSNDHPVIILNGG